MDTLKAARPACEAIKWGGNSTLPMYITANGHETRVMNTGGLTWRNTARPVAYGEFQRARTRILSLSLIDHFSWEQGWSAKFGLCRPQTQLRSRRRALIFMPNVGRGHYPPTW